MIMILRDVAALMKYLILEYIKIREFENYVI